MCGDNGPDLSPTGGGGGSPWGVNLAWLYLLGPATPLTGSARSVWATEGLPTLHHSQACGGGMLACQRYSDEYI